MELREMLQVNPEMARKRFGDDLIIADLDLMISAGLEVQALKAADTLGMKKMAEVAARVVMASDCPQELGDLTKQYLE